MIVSRHKRKVLFSSLTIAAALIYSLVGGSALAASEMTVTRDGDNITIESTDRAQNRFHVGKILADDMDDVQITINTNNSVNTSVSNSSDLPTTNMDTAQILGEILGNNTEHLLISFSEK